LEVGTASGYYWRCQNLHVLRVLNRRGNKLMQFFVFGYQQQLSRMAVNTQISFDSVKILRAIDPTRHYGQNLTIARIPRYTV